MPISFCPLCGHRDTHLFHSDKKRDYHRCQHCHLVFVPASQHLSRDEEKAIYDLHRNDAEDEGYRQFLSRLATPLLERLHPHAQGLDYGCGPGPLLASMLEEHGHTVKLYDPFYADHTRHLQQPYDFVTCTEVVEHFRHPRQAFESLFALLKPRGHLGLMTKLVIDAAAFSRWHYKNDQTHISFFSHPTLHWLAEQYHCDIEFIGRDVIIMTRKA